jgi:sugar phosphate isomerase/epimerase
MMLVTCKICAIAMQSSFTRRWFLHKGPAACAMGIALLQRKPLLANRIPSKNRTFIAYGEPLQRLDYRQTADLVADLGFDGLEATVRPGGHVEPERVQDDLPKLVDALRDRGLELTMMASNINRVDQPHSEKVLRTAASLNIPHYRMRGYMYDLQKPIPPQLTAFLPVIADLAALNAELGITGLIHNHAGVHHVGATVWDIHTLLKDQNPRGIGAVFDISHATAEAGVSWPIYFKLMRPLMQVALVKDFVWQDKGKMRWVPLGTGQIEPRYFEMLTRSAYDGPIGLHIEYDVSGGNYPEQARAAYRRDFSTLKSWLDG